MQRDTSAAPSGKWGIRVFHEPETKTFELRIRLPVGGEDELPSLLEPSVLTALPEIMRALESGRLPGNEVDLGGQGRLA